MLRTIILACLCTALFLTSCSYSRIGDLTVMANRNVGSTGDYQLVERGVEATAKMKNDDALERAIDDATASAPGGEFLQNVQVYVKGNGKKVKIVGDVWGTPTSTQTGLSAVTSDAVGSFKVGDAVTFKSGGTFVEGEIVGINPKGAVVKFRNVAKLERTKQVPFKQLTVLAEEGTTLARGQR